MTKNNSLDDKSEDIIYLIRKKILEEETETNNYALPKLLSKKVQTYMSMREDMILCSKTVIELLKLINDGNIEPHILTALWTSMLVCYSKCFTDASFAKKTKGEIKNFVDPSRKDLLEIHEKIMKVRHTFIAHRGDTDNEQAIVYLKLPKNKVHAIKTEYNIKSLRANNFGPQNLELCKELFACVLSSIEKKLYKEFEKLNDHIFTKHTAEDLHKWLIK